MTTITEFVSKYWLVILIILYLVVTINKSTSEEHMTILKDELPLNLQQYSNNMTLGPTNSLKSCTDKCANETGYNKTACISGCPYDNCIRSCTGNECDGGIAFVSDSYAIQDTSMNFDKTVSDSKCVYYGSTIDSTTQDKISNTYLNNISTTFDENIERKNLIINYAKEAYNKYGTITPPSWNTWGKITTLQNPTNPTLDDANTYIAAIETATAAGGTGYLSFNNANNMIGKKIPDGNDLPMSPNVVNSVFECEHNCGDDCRGWTYDKQTRQCSLKTDNIQNTSGKTPNDIKKLSWNEQKNIVPTTESNIDYISGFKPYFLQIPL